MTNDNERPVVNMQDILDNNIKTGEPIVISMPKSASTETKSAVDKMNNVLVENGAMVCLI
jgi:hypothetical protein